MADTGHINIKTLNKHYNEVFDEERQDLVQDIENNFYIQNKNTKESMNNDTEDVMKLIDKIKKNPDLAKVFMAGSA